MKALIMLTIFLVGCSAAEIEKDAVEQAEIIGDCELQHYATKPA